MLAYRLVHALLVDDRGISDEVYRALINWLTNHKNGSTELAERITHAAREVDGRWYVPEGTMFKPGDMTNECR